MPANEFGTTNKSYQWFHDLGLTLILLGAAGSLEGWIHKYPLLETRALIALTVGLIVHQNEFTFLRGGKRDFPAMGILPVQSAPLEIAASKQPLYIIPIISWLVATPVLVIVLRTLGLSIFLPLVPSDSAVAQQKVCLWNDIAATLLIVPAVFSAVRRKLKISRLYRLTRGREMVLSPNSVRISIGMLSRSSRKSSTWRNVNNLLTAHQPYLEIPWARIHSITLFPGSMASSYSVRARGSQPPYYDIWYDNTSVWVDRTFFSGEENKFLDYARSRNVRLTTYGALL